MKLFGQDGPIDEEAPELRHKEKNEVPQENLSTRPFQYFAAVSASLSLMACGTMLAWLTCFWDAASHDSDLIHFLTGNSSFISIAGDKPFRDMIADRLYWMKTLQPIGVMHGPLLAGVASDLFGRKRSLLFSGFLFLLSWVLIFPHNIWTTYTSRFIGGFSIGWTTSIIPVYLSEIATPKKRGAILVLGQIFFTFGFMYAYAFGSFVPMLWLEILCMKVSLLFLLTFWFMPESPYYLIKDGKLDAAEKSLMKLRGKNRVQIIEELKNIKVGLEGSKRSSNKCCSSLLPRANRKAFFLLFGLVIVYKFGGIDFVLYHSEQIFAKKWSELSITIAALIISSIQLVASLPAFYLIEYLGRRFLLLMSTFGITFCLTFMGYYFYKDFVVYDYLLGLPRRDLGSDSVNEVNSDWLLGILIIAYILLYSIGIGPVTWTMIGELFASDVRSKFVPIIVTFAWALQFMFIVCKDVLTIHSESYILSWFFAIICGIGTVCIYFFVPETAGKTFEQIQEELEEE